MKHRFLAVMLSAVVAAGVFCPPVQQAVGVAVTAEAATAAPEAPAASRKSGTYLSDGKFRVTLSCKTKGAEIYYSVNGGSTYKKYTQAFYITKSTKVMFYSKKDGVRSSVISRTYRLQPKFTITPNAGEYEGEQVVKLSSKVSGVRFYYTLDGSKPSTSSALYTSDGIRLDESCTLRIRTAKSGWSARYVSKDYDIEITEPSYSLESVMEDYTSKYAYSTLTSKQKKLYAALFDGVSRHKASINVSSLGCSAEDLEKAFYAMDYENPQFFWLASGYSYSYFAGSTINTVSPTYARSVTDAAIIRPQLEAAAEKILEEASRLETDYERVKLFHDTIINLTAYNSNGGEYKRDADGPLVTGEALCEGYSKAFAYLCQRAGIHCLCVSGYSSGPHMWNVLKLDGKWYQMDVTFDDPTGGEPTLEYTYFCLSTKQMSKDHTPDNPFTVPECNSTDYNYYKASGITQYDNSATAYSALLDEASVNYANGTKRTEIVCTVECVSELMSYINSKGSDIFVDLKLRGCSPSGLSYGYSSTKFYIELA